MLPAAIAAQRFQPITGRHSHITQLARSVQLIQFTPCYRLDIHPARYSVTLMQGFSVGAFERLYHGCILYRIAI